MSIVSEKIELINEDFGVHVQGVNTALELSNGASKVIKDDSDWCFCCRVYPEDRLTPIDTQNHNLYYDFNTGLNNHGIALGLNNVADTFRVFTFSGGAPISGGAISIPTILKKWSFICVNYTTASNLFEVYIDNILVGTVDKTSVYQPFGQDGNNSYLFSNHVPNNCLKGIAKGAIIYDRKLTNQERQYMYETGLPSESSFSNIQNYYPLNQVAFKDGGLNYFNDVVKVYNPNATSARAQAIGYTDDELGLDTYGRGCASTYYNYHNKKPLGNFGLKMNNWSGGENEQGWISVPMFDSVPVGDQPDFTTGYTIVCHGDSLSTDGAGPGGVPVLYRTTNGLGYLEFLGTSNITLSLPMVSASIVLGVISSVNHCVFTHKSNGDWYVIVDNKIIGSGNSTYYPPIDLNVGLNQGYRIGPLFSPEDDLKSYNYNVFFDYPLESSQVIEALPKHDWFTLNPYRAYSCATDINGDLIELVNGVYKGILQTANAHIPTDEDTLDVSSGFEPRKKGLSFNGTSQYLEVLNFTPTSEKGYTVIVGFDFEPSTSQRSIISALGTGGFTEYLDVINRGSSNGFGVTLPYQGSTTTGINLGSNFSSSSMGVIRWKANDGVIIPYSNSVFGIIDLFGRYTPDGSKISGQTIIDWASNTPRTLIGARRNGGGAVNYFNKPVTYCAIFKGVLHYADLKFIYNNGLFNNPKPEQLDKYDLELYVDFNNPFDDGGTLKFPDLSPNNHTIVANGWTNLSELINSLVNKETLF